MGSCQSESRPLALRAPRDGIADVEAEDGLGAADFTLWRGSGGLLVLDQELDHAVEGPQRHLRTARHPAQQGVLGNVQLVGQRLIALVHCGGLRERPREDGVGHHACRELLLGMLTPSSCGQYGRHSPESRYGGSRKSYAFRRRSVSWRTMSKDSQALASSPLRLTTPS